MPSRHNTLWRLSIHRTFHGLYIRPQQLIFAGADERRSLIAIPLANSLATLIVPRHGIVVVRLFYFRQPCADTTGLRCVARNAVVNHLLIQSSDALRKASYHTSTNRNPWVSAQASTGAIRPFLTALS